MKRAFQMAVLAAVCGVACAQEDTNLYYKVFYFLPSLDERLASFDDVEYKKLLSEQSGAAWPTGSQIIHPLDEKSQVIIRNTRSNITKLEAYFVPYTEERQVALELQVFAFRVKDVESLLNRGGVSCDNLLDLRKMGHAKLVTTARSVTRSGQETVVKDVQELLYPTELEYRAMTNQNSVAWALVPSKFEMRELGTIFQVIPDFGESGTSIRLILNPQWISLNRWETFDAFAGSKSGGQKVQMRQPVISASVIQTQLKIESGETVLLGGGKTSDGDWVQYHFLKAWLVWPKAPK